MWRKRLQRRTRIIEGECRRPAENALVLPDCCAINIATKFRFLLFGTDEKSNAENAEEENAEESCRRLRRQGT